MSAPLIFDVTLGFDRLTLIGPDRDPDPLPDIPASLVERPDVLAALLLIARAGGLAVLKRVQPEQELLVDPDEDEISVRAVQW